MNLTSFTAAGRAHRGLATPGGVIAMDGVFPQRPGLRAVIAAGGLPMLIVAEWVEGGRTLLPHGSSAQTL